MSIGTMEMNQNGCSYGNVTLEFSVWRFATRVFVIFRVDDAHMIDGVPHVPVFAVLVPNLRLQA